MIGKIIGAAVGAKAAKESKALGGVTGFVTAAAVPFVLKRLSIPTMIVMGAGGYAAKRFFEKREAQDTAQNLSGAKIKSPATTPGTDTGTVIDPPPGGGTNGSGKLGTPTAGTA